MTLNFWLFHLYFLSASIVDVDYQCLAYAVSGNQIQDFEHARQVVYQLSYISSPQETWWKLPKLAFHITEKQSTIWNLSELVTRFLKQFHLFILK